MWMDGGDIAWMIVILILLVTFWVGIVGAIIWAIVRFTRGAHSVSSTKPNFLDIAKERYARGEITKEQYEELKKDLS